jgi:hypothetical protein
VLLAAMLLPAACGRAAAVSPPACSRAALRRATQPLPPPLHAPGAHAMHA